MNLSTLFAANSNLSFVEAATGKFKNIRQMQESLQIDEERSLVFVYNDNQLLAIEAFLNFYRSQHTVALLGNNVSIDFKVNLENTYKPAYIFDPQRQQIQGYMLEKFSECISIFRRIQYEPINIHPKIKLLLSTSGTTGSPKFVRLSDENLVENANSILDYMPILPSDIAPLNVPINFVYGLSIFTTNCIRAAKIVCTDKNALQNEFWLEYIKYGYSTLGGVPYFYEMLRRIGFFKKEHPSLRYLTHTGGMLNHELITEIDSFMKRSGVKFIAQYGQTEAGGRMAYLPPQDLLRKSGSIGRPIKNGSFLIDAKTNELLYTGPNVSGGYATNCDDLSEYHEKRSLHTGDQASVDKEGYYYITGRIKRIVKLFGTRFNLDEAELILKNALGGKTIICIGLNDKKLGVYYQDDNLDADLISKTIQEKFGINRSATKIRYIADVPLTANGKVNYPLLQEWISASDIPV